MKYENTYVVFDITKGPKVIIETLDTFGDDNVFDFEIFKAFLASKLKSGGKATYWNNLEKEYNPHSFDSISFEKIVVTPDSNNYTEIQNHYYMPKVVA